MHADVIRHVAQVEGPKVLLAAVEEGSLKAQDRLHHLGDRALPLVDRLDQPLGGAELLAHVLLRLFALMSPTQHRAVRVAHLEARQAVFVQHHVVFVGDLLHEDVWRDVDRLLEPRDHLLVYELLTRARLKVTDQPRRSGDLLHADVFDAANPSIVLAL